MEEEEKLNNNNLMNIAFYSSVLFLNYFIFILLGYLRISKIYKI